MLNSIVKELFGPFATDPHMRGAGSEGAEHHIADGLP
jgi:hypothetical protein